MTSVPQAANICSIETDVCTGCGVARPISEFRIRVKGGLDSRCRACIARYQHDWYMANRDAQIARARRRGKETAAANRVLVYTYLSEHPCVDCGENDPAVLEFDHVGTKYRDISLMTRAGFAWTTIEAEIAKCVVRCANCHRRKTAREQGIYEYKHSFRAILEAATRYRFRLEFP